MSKAASQNFVKCGEHGRSVWLGHVVCSSCNRVFQTTDEHAVRYAPEMCACGVRLMPSDPPGAEFSARSICAACFFRIIATD